MTTEYQWGLGDLRQISSLMGMLVENFGEPDYFLLDYGRKYEWFKAWVFFDAIIGTSFHMNAKIYSV